ncbi:MAG: adenylate/guanylate cyclase with Chase sensor [Myxococcales bacterium]|nr:adenylate/guanylate cyclase with Chase sensor [Myxococcales bacterium]
MKRARNVPFLTAIAATIAVLGLLAVHLWMTALPGLDALEGLSIDARFRMRGPRAPESDRVVIVGLDDATRERYPEVFQTRRGWAKLIRALSRYDVKVIALDLFFSAPEVILPDELTARVRAADVAATPEPPAAATAEHQVWVLQQLLAAIAEELRGDETLAAAIAESKRVYLGAFFRQGKGPAEDTEPPQLVFARHGEVADAGGGGGRRPIHSVSVEFTLPEIAHGAAGAGALNTFRDPDSVTRRVPLAIEYGGRHYMPLGLAVALAELGKSGNTLYLVGDDVLVAGGRALPIGKAASASLDMLGRGQLARVSAADVLAGTAPKSALAGKLVFAGFTFASADKITTPLDAIADGVELHATLTENVLAGRLMKLAGPGTTILATLGLCALVIAAQLRRIRRRAWAPPIAALLGIATYCVIAFVMFEHGTIVAVAAPIAMGIVVLVAATIGGLATEGREKANLRNVFSRYVSKTVVDRILADPSRAKLGGERKELTVLFSDIRGFSSFSEGMGPEALMSFLGEYLTPMTELVLESGGTLDKYIGDAVMAIWAAPVDVPDHAARACEVALRMQDALVALNKKWTAEGKPQIAIGIGVNTGAMAVGNMGTAARFDYTVLGDQVNLGARLEGLTKEYGVGILVTEATVRAAGPAFVFREIDLVRVKGRAGAAPVYELLGRVGKPVDTRFAEALAAYRKRDFAAAKQAFAVLADDPVAETMAERCAVLAEQPPPGDWDGVYDQRAK